jgi:DNA-binding LacI/PurR family transcriptional regulator
MDEIRIDRDGAIPLHAQLLNQLRHLILSHKWEPDTQIPSEPELQRRLSISRSTIRQALRNAESEGLIVRVPGKGTFVTFSALDQRSHLVGYITDDCCDPMQSLVLTGAEHAVNARGFRILFGNSNGSVEEESRILDQLVLEDRVAGILVWPVPRMDQSGRLLQLCHQRALPLVAVDRTLEGLSCDFVTSQNYAGAHSAVTHLLELGHRRIAFLSHPIQYVTTIVERLQGYRDAMRDAGLTPWEPWLVGSTKREASIRAAAKNRDKSHKQSVDQITRYLNSDDRPTAIFAVNDVMAVLAMRAARTLGLGVPKDLSLVGFDDNDIIHSLLDVSLTMVAQDAHAIGRRGAQLLIERIEGYQGLPRREHLPTHLRVRGSTAAPMT